jgi:hypothetical protein
LVASTVNDRSKLTFGLRTPGWGSEETLAIDKLLPFIEQLPLEEKLEEKLADCSPAGRSAIMI